jgi:hypothetical protein
MSDDAGDTQWMTYAELAAACGIDRRSAMRRKWRREKGKDGRIRVAVPLAYLASQATDDQPSDTPHDTSSDIFRATTALEKSLATLQKQLKRECNRADATAARAVDAQARAEQAEVRERELCGRMAELRAELRDLKAEASEWAAWSIWRRLRWAFTGGRG